jgi:nitrite reductase/ring-hydroxylating ferredoxin subunit
MIESEAHPHHDESRRPVDRHADSPGREGLTGTTPANLYKRIPADREQITIPPNWGTLHSQPAWRKDFPIDWPQDAYVARRDFTKFLGLTSLAFVIGQLWIGAENVLRRSRGKPPIRRIALLSAVPIGGTLQFDYPGEHDACILVRLGPDELVAYGQKCTHLSCAVIPRVDKGQIHCPCHEGFFDLATGDVLAGPPPRPLPRGRLEPPGDDVYSTRIERRT